MASPRGVQFEEILKLAGDAGLWQLLVFAWSMIGGVMTGIHNVSSAFVGGVPEHRCALDGDTANSTATEEELKAWLPWDNTTGRPESCSRRTAAGGNSTTVCDAWVYSRERYTSTIVSEWDLVCDNLWMMSTVQASYMFGIFCGAMISGVLSDQFGRRRAVCVSGVLFFVSSLTTAGAGSYTAFVALRFITAMSGAGVFGCMFILLMEVVGPRWRALVGLVYQIPFSCGFMSLPAAAYFVRDWRHLQLVISSPAVIMLGFWWSVPESPRWLIMQDRLPEALQVLRAAARRNKRRLPPDDELLNMMSEFRAAEVKLASGGDDKTGNRSALQSCTAGVCEMSELVRTPRLRRISLASFYNWLVVSMIYYGVTFNSADLSSNPYLAIFLAGLVEIPAVLLSVPLINRIGRRPSMVATHLLTGAAILCIMAVPRWLAWPKLALGMLGKFAASAAFGIIYLYTAEYFPTTLRNAGFGASSTCARIGSMSAPYIVDLLSPVHWTIPSCVFGLCGVTAALAALLLPETNGRRLPETVADIERGVWERVRPPAAEPLHTTSL